MNETPTTAPAVPDTHLYKLVTTRLGSDPLDFIRERRNRDVPMAFVRITNEMLGICNKGVTDPNEQVYFTHEVPRRWLYATDGNPAAAK